uniref:CSON005302 protein n=1 Tax=Culicoides sonorensis TaxID=179676 RepID=A0A336L961_CULSO
MVIGDATTSQQQQPPCSQVQPQFAGATIDNIMHGIENTGTVKMNNHRKKLRQRFDIIKKLGQGTYGKVQLGINKETGQEVAIKTIKKSKIETEADLIRIRREVQIMSSVQHPNIIHIYEVFENREKMVLVMEFAAGGELYDYLSERKVLAEEEARRIFRQVSTAIYYCHKHKICHRDLKLENILLDEHGNAKIADFGLSNVFDEQRLLATFCGSPLYASPEIVKGTPYLGPEVDCWSLGVLLYTLVYGAMPFDGANFKRLVKQISMGDYFEPKKPSRASPLIREMLTVCPKRRANIESICNHWWVNETYNESCLTLAEELANQTPVRLDVLLSLAPPSVTADQLVVSAMEPEQSTAGDRLQKSHSVGSVIDIGGTEAERRIIDMVQHGGEAALMPSPTRTITPQESPAQPKRKLEPTMSVENATGAARKKDKPAEAPIPETMDVEQSPKESPIVEQKPSEPEKEPTQEEISKDLAKINSMCDELLNSSVSKPAEKQEKEKVPQISKKESTPKVEEKKESPAPKADAPTIEKKTVRKTFNKGKTVDLSGTIDKATDATKDSTSSNKKATVERKNSLPDESAIKAGDRRKSRILETAEKFQSMNNQNNEKYKKFVIPGVSVGSFKKEFERKASITASTVGPMERKQRNSESSSRQNSQEDPVVNQETSVEDNKQPVVSTNKAQSVKESDSKSSVGSFSLEDARKSMENSIALLKKERSDSEKELIAAKQQSVPVQQESVNNGSATTTTTTTKSSGSGDGLSERERKLKNAREIISNAIPRLGGGSSTSAIRRPPMPFGSNGRTPSGNLATGYSKPVRLGDNSTNSSANSTPTTQLEHPPSYTSSKAGIDDGNTKTSRAEITATLPRRKPAKTEISLDVKTKQIDPVSNTMRFNSEISSPVQNIQTAPIRDSAPTFTASVVLQNRSSSVDPQKEHVVPIQKPPSYQRQISGGSNYQNTGSVLSRQSTNESNDSDTTISQTLNTSASASSTQQPIKKSPREFIIPIAVEGGGVVTPRVGDGLEQSESTATTNSASSFASKRLGRPRKLGSLFNDDDDPLSSFQNLKRHTSLGRESDTEEPRFHTMHRLRSSRPSKRPSTAAQEPNDSGSSGDEDDEDAFEILTAENLFSTLLSRVKALTQRVNANNDFTTSFPSSRLFDNMRQTRSPFWNNEPFGRLKIPTNITITTHANNNKSNISIQLPSQVKYTYSTETVTETKKRTRLNNNSGGHPWRSTLSRDFQNDIDQMFSRSGATTLPRGEYRRLF